MLLKSIWWSKSQPKSLVKQKWLETADQQRSLEILQTELLLGNNMEHKGQFNRES